MHGGKDGRASCEKSDRACENVVITAQSFEDCPSVIGQKEMHGINGILCFKSVSIESSFAQNWGSCEVLGYVDCYFHPILRNLNTTRIL